MFTQLDTVSISWLAMGAFFIILEAMSIPGVGFFFAGLGAMATGGLVAFGILPFDNFLVQIMAFFAFTAVWSAILWVPLKRFSNRESKERFTDVIGKTAIVTKKGLSKSTTGKVVWSGVKMLARIDSKCAKQEFSHDDEVIIVDIKGNVLIVSSIEQ